MIDITKSIRTRVLEDNYGKNDPIDLFHPSSAGNCERQIFLSKLGVKLFSEEVRGAMQIGTVIHEWVQDMEEVKDNFFIEQVHVLEIPNTKLYFQGKIDLKDKKTGYVIDIKSIKNLFYAKFKPMTHHVAQINVYMAMANVIKADLVYVQKHNLETKTHTVNFDKILLEETFEKIKRVYEALKNFDQENPKIPFKKCECYSCREEKLIPEFKKALKKMIE